MVFGFLTRDASLPLLFVLPSHPGLTGWYGVNISNWPEGMIRRDAKPVEVELRPLGTNHLSFFICSSV